MQVSLIEIAIIILVLTIALFLLAFTGFIQGVRLGMRTVKGIEPQPLKNPVQIIHEIKQDAEQRKENELLMQDLEAVNNYTGDLPKGGGK
jgi:hypothetical protein